MPLIMGLLSVFAVVALAAFAYQLARGRRLVVAAHYATVFGLAIMMLVYVAAIALDLLDITPEPPVAAQADSAG